MLTKFSEDELCYLGSFKNCIVPIRNHIIPYPLRREARITFPHQQLSLVQRVCVWSLARQIDSIQ